MKKNNNISSKIFKIISITKFIMMYIILLTELIPISEFIVNLTSNTTTILQTIMFFLSFIMIINCISVKSKSWKYYLFSIIAVIIEYNINPVSIGNLPSCSTSLIIECVISGFIYAYASKKLKKENENQNTNMSIPQNIKKTNYIYFIILALLFVLYSTNKIILNINKNTEEYDIKQIIPEPIQTDYNKIITVKKNGKKYQLEYVAKYTIIGRVVNTKRYYGTNAQGRLCSFDVGIVWGESGIEENAKKISAYNLGGRSMNIYSYQSNTTLRNHELSNNHLIPKNNKIKREMALIKEGDYIKMEGYLTNIIVDGEYHIQSSITRYDEGFGACETIYVTNITWLTDKK